MANLIESKPPVSEWRDGAGFGEGDRARWINDSVWACEVNESPGHGYAWLVWDAEGANILAEGTAPKQGDAERACDAAAVQWYALPVSAVAVH